MLWIGIFLPKNSASVSPSTRALLRIWSTPAITALLIPTHFSGFSGINFACPAGAGCAVLDNGPSDHGALFQFLFKKPDLTPLALGPGETLSFKIFYGAAPNKSEAADALSKVGAEVYSFGYPPLTKGCNAGNDGSPNVFIFGFAGVGGDPIINKPPTAVCKDVEISAAAGCQASITLAMIDGGSTDPQDD